ncbi:Aerolysin [Vibrio crassostreae]|uniref:aerolysin family beta-barrel pore-forming toxin n=1 Tax=Vibrio crassostreae TaxID=246167 RepID=UPI00148CD9B4|nr:aerolysin family beta-barrel pore-forming toxin [Vibrio crassostreae]NOI55307.1 aerolysin family beta-barrel pore-forming toxin [Vibrio crassostreae]CAK1748223.1 Aerolysin [Vibrio crassostreae]CAK1765398.1 Aerolysin [Vibrio crassostreae]CAK1766241.1 Aerolysin [Vibrio crassostreae]CAK1766785.1 Aerolysin [Vibrio crassostreae]
MIRIKRSLLATAVLSVLSTGVNAKIYPDQIVHDQLGDDVCRSGYRPLDRFEAEEQKSALLARMGTWQITGLKGNWVIMGPGYNGLIKQDTTNGKTFCYPNNDQSEIPNYSAKSVPEGSELDVQYELVNNRNDFVRPLSYLAHNLGYAWVGGNNSQYVGEDMTINRSGDSWVIQGNNGGSCSGYRCGEKTKITVDNFAYTVNDDNFWHGDVVESDRELVKTVYATARNNSNIAQQVVVDLKVDESTNWSKTNSYGFSQSVQTENTFKWPLVGETKLTIKFEANQSFSKSNGGSTSEQVTLQARPMVPANSELPIRVELYRSSISYPYRFNADISYDVEFNGFLRWSGNAWHTHPDNRPYKAHTFTMGRGSDKSADIRYQWDHRYIPGETKWWDWGWAIKEAGLSSMQYATGGSLRPFHSYVSGDFYADSQFAGTIEIGQATPIVNNLRSKRSTDSVNETTERIGDIEVTTNFNADELSDLGFEGAEMNISVVE